MGIAEIGPLTSALESLATAVGAGLLLGSFAIGSLRFLAGTPGRDLEAQVLTNGYWGGIASVWLVLGDLAVRYSG